MSRSTKNPPTDPLESTKATGNQPRLIVKTTANPLPFLYTCHHGHAPGQQAALVLAAQGSSDHGDQLVQGASLAGDRARVLQSDQACLRGHVLLVPRQVALLLRGEVPRGLGRGPEVILQVLLGLGMDAGDVAVFPLLLHLGEVAVVPCRRRPTTRRRRQSARPSSTWSARSAARWECPEPDCGFSGQSGVGGSSGLKRHMDCHKGITYPCLLDPRLQGDPHHQRLP